MAASGVRDWLLARIAAHAPAEPLDLGSAPEKLQRLASAAVSLERGEPMAFGAAVPSDLPGRDEVLREAHRVLRVWVVALRRAGPDFGELLDSLHALAERNGLDLHTPLERVTTMPPRPPDPPEGPRAAAFVSSFDPTDGVGVVTLPDGATLRFGASAMPLLAPRLGMEVVVLETAPHPLGGLKVQRMEPSSDLHRALHEAAARARAAGRPTDALSAHLDELVAAHRRRNAALSYEALMGAWLELLHAAEIDPDAAARVVARAKPGARLRPGRAETELLAVGSSKLGGEPDLPTGTKWPERQGRPLAFLAQIRVDDVLWDEHLRGAPLARGVLLSFFYAREDEQWGNPEERDGWRVVSSAIGNVERRVRPPAVRMTPERSLAFEPSLMLPAFGSNQPRDVPVRSYADVLRAGARLTGDGPMHSFLGEADPVQFAMEADCARLAGESPESASDWHLLLQLDSDDAANWEWGDYGRLYFWVRAADATADRYENTWCFMQCT